MSSKEWIVQQKHCGQRLQNFLKEQMDASYSGKQIKSFIDGYHCRVNGKIELFSSYKIRRGDRILLLVEHKEKHVKSLKKDAILYEDNDLIVMNKPCGLVCRQEEIRELFGHKPYLLVHRLDKETTGAFMIAKHSAAQKQLESAFKDKEIHKIYHALAQGQSAEHMFRVENTLGKLMQYQGQTIWGEVHHKQGLHALTNFQVLKCGFGYTLMECAPVTGRTHQIRVHLKEKGLPILGDYHYYRDKPFSYAAKRTLLHAYSLSFSHPITQKRVEIIAPYPEDFVNALKETFR